ncbi:unknown [Eggerthella sp. CAG:368]|nr:unknown [Eggerthella sp. CAG:368]
MSFEKIAPLSVYMDDSKVLEFSFASNIEAKNKEEKRHELIVNYKFLPQRNDKGDIVLDFVLDVDSNGAPTYDIHFKSRTIFIFLDDATEDQKDEYLKDEGALKVIDIARTYIKIATASGVYESFSIPAFSPRDSASNK